MYAREFENSASERALDATRRDVTLVVAICKTRYLNFTYRCLRDPK